MTLKDLKGVINFEFDIADDEIDASVYINLNEIRDEYAADIEVTRIDRDVVICRITDFLRRKYLGGTLRKYIDGAYYDDDPAKEMLKRQLLMPVKERMNGGDITNDGGYAVAYFIEYDLNEFLTHDIGEYI